MIMANDTDEVSNCKSALNDGLEREAFEKWINKGSGHDRATERGPGDSYVLMQTHLYWLAWKKRASLHVYHGEYICHKCGIRQSLGVTGDGEF